MSKHTKSKRKSKNSNSTNKTFSKLKMLISIAVVILIIGIVAIVVILNANSDTAKIKKALCQNLWTPVSAQDASNDEVEMAQVYNTDYSSYKGSLEYYDDDTFNFWMSPGLPDDGTHSGRYEVSDNSTVNMYFDDGTNTKFSIEYSGDEVLAIEVNYDSYKITFGSIE